MNNPHKLRLMLLWILPLVLTTGPGVTLRGQTQPSGAGLRQLSRDFAVDGLQYRLSLKAFLGLQEDAAIPPELLRGQETYPFPASTATSGPVWGSVELADKRVVFLDGALYAVEMDFTGKRNTLAILDRTRELFGPRESLRGRFGLPSGRFDTVPQELIKQWDSPRLTAILTYWDNLEGGTLRILDRERYEERMAPQRERREEARNRLNNSILELDWGTQRNAMGGEEYVPDLPERDDATAPTPADEAVETPGDDRSRLEEQHRGGRWTGSAVDDLFE